MPGIEEVKQQAAGMGRKVLGSNVVERQEVEPLHALKVGAALVER
jgi:hypothetical protein